MGQNAPVELRSSKELVCLWLSTPTQIPQQYPVFQVLCFYKPAQSWGSFACGLCSAGCWRVPWSLAMASTFPLRLGWLFFQPVPMFSDLCYYTSLKPRSLSRDAQHGIWHILSTGVCAGSRAVSSNCGALPSQGDPGDPGVDGAKGARGDIGSPGLPGERVGAGSLVWEAAGQRHLARWATFCRRTEGPGVQGLVGEHPEPPPFPHAPLLNMCLYCRVRRAPVAPLVHG